MAHTAEEMTVYVSDHYYEEDFLVACDYNNRGFACMPCVFQPMYRNGESTLRIIDYDEVYDEEQRYIEVDSDVHPLFEEAIEKGRFLVGWALQEGDDVSLVFIPPMIKDPNRRDQLLDVDQLVLEVIERLELFDEKAIDEFLAEGQQLSAAEA